MAELQTCTGCRKQKPVDEFTRRGRNNATCNACSERLRIRKLNAAAAAKEKQEQQQQEQKQQATSTAQK